MKAILTVSLKSPLLFLALILGACNGKKAQNKEKEIPVSSLGISNEKAHSGNEILLMEFAFSGNKEGLVKMMDKTINVNAIDEEGRSALMLASFNGYHEIVKILLEKGAEVNIQDYSGRTALIYASTGPFTETVRLLLDNGADPNIVDKSEQFSALMFAAAEGQADVVKILLEYKADPGLKDKDGDDAETFARQNGHLVIADLLKAVVSK